MQTNLQSFCQFKIIWHEEMGKVSFELSIGYKKKKKKKKKNTKMTKLNLFLKSVHKHTQFTNVTFVYYVSNQFMG